MLSTLWLITCIPVERTDRFGGGEQSRSNSLRDARTCWWCICDDIKLCSRFHLGFSVGCVCYLVGSFCPIALLYLPIFYYWGRYPAAGIKYWMLSKMFVVLILFLLWVSAAFSISHIPIFHRGFSLCLNAWFVGARERVCVDQFHLWKLCVHMISVSELHQGCVLSGKPVNWG